MSENSDDLTEKPCKCNGVMHEIIGFEYCLTDENYKGYRAGWYCEDCKEFEKAILRERQIKLH
jgi:hypothetical protein